MSTDLVARVGVGVLIVDSKSETFLALRRAKGPLIGEWTVPGGKVDFGETAQAGAIREIAEEVDLVLDPSRLHTMLHVDHIEIDKNHHFSGPAYVYYWDDNEDGFPVNKEPEKHSDMTWLPLTAPPIGMSYPSKIAIDYFNRELLPFIHITHIS